MVMVMVMVLVVLQGQVASHMHHTVILLAIGVQVFAMDMVNITIISFTTVANLHTSL